MKTALGLAALAALAVAAAAAQEIPGASMRNHDSSAPIDFDAGRIEVREAESQAIISGDVHVTQGSLDLDAERIRVFYNDGADRIQVDRLDADGGVTVRTPAETARAQSALYDVPGEQITMIGDVVLTRGSDVLRGQRLIIDLGSGRSTFDAAVNAESGEGGRVTGSFTPSNVTNP
ncbi:LptA/OstA family protein [Pacificimonas sp. ICDLI1SI03]|jgi:lipopolysaccharide export system protein LptA|tara:strand:- start:85082 stop:85609 length:528 start_codon:yes stop_codon:yes gene_type:complete